ncbi:ABC-2 type transport system ATP-binding protein [Marinilabilia salmonicolor]|uniref:ABC-2 type transport system ATP-binding protein n=2 Tax=Marinilabilia salmonicolor TaxID=989 RepID=A0A368UM17_9BACT|nr:ABC-2 type transport system ATP-binding protein [Marinilabilia salmonicolor]
MILYGQTLINKGKIQTMENVIECRHLTHYYGDRCIYEDLNFAIPKGRIVGLLGKNGTGKTTTINILNGYLQPKSGECRMFGQNAGQLSPSVKQKVALLLEGHVQYSFMNIAQIEKFYASFYPLWDKAPFWELMNKLKIAPKQRISRMSCGQRSQVALGIILAQNADLLILDDFSMGLDPGYRRLFVDYLSEYAHAEDKTVFVTSHIIQDMERLIDDCMILDYGKLLLQQPVDRFLNSFKRYQMTSLLAPNWKKMPVVHPEKIRNKMEFYSDAGKQTIVQNLKEQGFETNDLQEESLTLEEAFIGLTGKY